VTVFASAARTATPDTFEYELMPEVRAIHLVWDVTAVTSTPSTTVTIQGVDRLSGKVYTLLASAAIAAVSTNVLSCGAGAHRLGERHRVGLPPAHHPHHHGPRQRELHDLLDGRAVLLVSIITTSELKAYRGHRRRARRCRVRLGGRGDEPGDRGALRPHLRHDCHGERVGAGVPPDLPGRVKVDDFWSTTGLIVKTDGSDDGTYETTWTITTDFILEPLNGLRHGQTWPYDKIVAVGGKLFPRGRAPVGADHRAWGWAAIPGVGPRGGVAHRVA
jgi:hypothetical protein